jgi:hypothetical protein
LLVAVAFVCGLPSGRSFGGLNNSFSRRLLFAGIIEKTMLLYRENQRFTLVYFGDSFLSGCFAAN